MYLSGIFHFQDCLENFFGQIRNKCGCGTNPTMVQFVGAYRSLAVNRLILPCERGNCKPDLDSFLINLLDSKVFCFFLIFYLP